MKYRNMTGVAVLAAGLLVAGRGMAGSLDPTNAPGPTMYTLEEIYQRVSGFGVPKTGQTNSYVANDDGAYQDGVAWPRPRFTAGTGTSNNCVRDNLTGLMWLKNPDATTRTWTNAITYCEGLDGSSGRGGYSDWRLPNARELESLMDFGRYMPALPSGHPFALGATYFYWSSTTFALSPANAWYVDLRYGTLEWDAKTNAYYVFPVRTAP